MVESKNGTANNIAQTYMIVKTKKPNVSNTDDLIILMLLDILFLLLA